MNFYLDTMIISNLAKPGGASLQANLLSFLAKKNAKLAISFHHIGEIVAIDSGTRTYGTSVLYLPLEIGKMLDRCPINELDGGPAVVDVEFREAYAADAQNRPPKQISPPGWGEWKGPPPVKGKRSVSDTIARIHDKDRRGDARIRFKAIADQNAAFRATRKAEYESGKERKPLSLEAAIDMERAALRQSIFKTNSCWPPSGLYLTPQAEQARRRQFLDRLNFPTCSALNLFGVLMAHHHFHLGSQHVNAGGLSDPWHAAIGCHYADRFVTEDKALYRALVDVKPLAPYPADVFTSLSAALAD